jgi:signal transduction histidine kinase
MHLADFIRANEAEIIADWQKFAATLVPAAADMSPHALRNHIKQMLIFIANDIESPQTADEKLTKSHGKKDSTGGHSAAEIHAALRLAGGFNLPQIVSEFRALRASVMTLWEKQITTASSRDIRDINRFHEAVDQSITESVNNHAKKIAAAKDLNLKILQRDLAGFLGTITVSAGLMLRIGKLYERQSMLVSQIIESSARASETIAHLIDLTRARFGSGLPLTREAMHMGFIVRTVVDEVRMQHPNRKFNVEISGDLEGRWDKPRIGQLVSNLLGNAVRFGFSDTTISVTLIGDADEVILSIQNDGVVITAAAIEKLFDSLNSTEPEEDNIPDTTVNLGLGLYIAKEIVTAHGGDINVTSSEKNGTTFTARFPRRMR